MTNEHLKHGLGDNLLAIVAKLVKIMCSRAIFSAYLNLSVIKPIIKSGKPPGEAASYRPISLSEPIANLYESFVLQKINSQYPDKNEQFGFKRLSSCLHAIFKLKETIARNAHPTKTIFLIAIDASKAFDRLVREALFTKLQRRIDYRLWSSIRNYYGQSNAFLQNG